MTDTHSLAGAANEVPVHLWQGDIARIDHSMLRVPDLDAGIAWYTRLLGLVPTGRQADHVYLASPVTGRIVLGLSATGANGLERLSLLTRGPQALERIAARLAEANIPFERGGAADSRPGTRAVLWLKLPSQHVIEVLDAEDPYIKKGAPPAPGYQLGAMDVRTSHIQFRTLDVGGTSALLQVLGFKVSAYVRLPGAEPGKYFIQFLRANDVHHQVALLTGSAGMHHVALELDTADFWRFCDHLAYTRIAAEYGPGRHHEGDMLFLYLRDPFGNRLEIDSPMALAGFDYPPHELNDKPQYHMNMWGPQPPESWEKEWT